MHAHLEHSHAPFSSNPTPNSYNTKHKYKHSRYIFFFKDLQQIGQSEEIRQHDQTNHQMDTTRRQYHKLSTKLHLRPERPAVLHKYIGDRTQRNNKNGCLALLLYAWTIVGSDVLFEVLSTNTLNTITEKRKKRCRHSVAVATCQSFCSCGQQGAWWEVWDLCWKGAVSGWLTAPSLWLLFHTHTHTHTHTHARPHARTHARTHRRVESATVISVSVRKLHG